MFVDGGFIVEVITFVAKTSYEGAGISTTQGNPSTTRLSILVSDHGWGHATRVSLLATEALRRGWQVLLVCSPPVAALLRREAPDAEVLEASLDHGIAAQPGGLQPDVEATRVLLEEALRGPDPALVTAVAAWRPDAVLADATPWAPSVAAAAGVPSVLVSNFSWEEQYAALLGESPEVARLRTEVARFDLGLALPLGTPLPALPRVEPAPLVARLPRDDAWRGVPGIAWAFGRNAPERQPLAALRPLAGLAAARGLPLYAERAIAEAARSTLGALPALEALPADVHMPSLLAASRLVVTKAGYSTLAETLRGRGRVLMLTGSGSAEESAMRDAMEAAGHGLHVDTAAAGWDERAGALAERLLTAPVREPLLERGEGGVLDRIAALLAERRSA